MGKRTMDITTTLTHDVRPVDVDAKTAKRIAAASTKRPTGCDANGFGPFPRFDSTGQPTIARVGMGWETSIGLIDGSTIQTGQNRIFEMNREIAAATGRGLTNNQIALIWSYCWPLRCAPNGYRADQTTGALRDYCRGKHGNTTIPAPGLGQWDDNGAVKWKNGPPAIDPPPTVDAVGAIK